VEFATIDDLERIVALMSPTDAAVLAGAGDPDDPTG
jgi:hypothetical protein